MDKVDSKKYIKIGLIVLGVIVALIILYFLFRAKPDYEHFLDLMPIDEEDVDLGQQIKVKLTDKEKNEIKENIIKNFKNELDTMYECYRKKNNLSVSQMNKLDKLNDSFKDCLNSRIGVYIMLFFIKIALKSQNINCDVDIVKLVKDNLKSEIVKTDYDFSSILKEYLQKCEIQQSMLNKSTLSLSKIFKNRL